MLLWEIMVQCSGPPSPGARGWWLHCSMVLAAVATSLPVWRHSNIRSCVQALLFILSVSLTVYFLVKRFVCNFTEYSSRGFPIGFFNPAIPTKIFSQSRYPNSFYLPIPIMQFCFGPFPKCKRASSLDDDLLNQHWSVEFYDHRKAWVYLFSPKWWYRSFKKLSKFCTNNVR